MMSSAALTPFRSSPMLTVGHSVLHSASPSTPAHQHSQQHSQQPQPSATFKKRVRRATQASVFGQTAVTTRQPCSHNLFATPRATAPAHLCSASQTLAECPCSSRVRKSCCRLATVLRRCSEVAAGLALLSPAQAAAAAAEQRQGSTSAAWTLVHSKPSTKRLWIASLRAGVLQEQCRSFLPPCPTERSLMLLLFLDQSLVVLDSCIDAFETGLRSPAGPSQTPLTAVTFQLKKLTVRQKVSHSTTNPILSHTGCSSSSEDGP